MSFSSSTEAVTVQGLSIKKFESQSEVDEKKKKRQEEWEKVRKPDDPTECPEAPVDNRCLYDKLEEQRLKKQEEFEEQTAFKNQIKRLDDDEVEFLDFVSERQQEISRAKNKEEAEIMSELKTAQVVKLGESKDEGKKSKPSQQTATKRSQSALLSGAVKKKRPEESSPSSKKARLSSTDSPDSQPAVNEENSEGDLEKTISKPRTQQADSVKSVTASTLGLNSVKNVGEVVAVLPSVLPGMNQYEDSTDSQSSSSDSEPDFQVASVFSNKMQQSR